MSGYLVFLKCIKLLFEIKYRGHPTLHDRTFAFRRWNSWLSKNKAENINMNMWRVCGPKNHTTIYIYVNAYDRNITINKIMWRCQAEWQSGHTVTNSIAMVSYTRRDSSGTTIHQHFGNHLWWKNFANIRLFGFHSGFVIHSTARDRPKWDALGNVPLVFIRVM